jgi:hypothetical protein
MNRLSLVLVVGLAASALAMLPDEVTGCAPVPHRDQHVYTSEETAFIVWNEETKTEHFVRRASFRSTGYDFGFLVPTPNPPAMLDVVDDDVFNKLADLTAARIEYREVVEERMKEFLPGCAAKNEATFAAGMEPKSAADKHAGGVDVLQQKRIGDYDAAVLRFRKDGNDTPERGAAELEKWLITHGYETPPAVKEWLTKYVKDGWCITAFKIATPEPKKDIPEPKSNPNSPARINDLRAKPVLMSFKTEKPFYPYREPATEPTAHPEPRLLRVYFASVRNRSAENRESQSARYEGKLGDGTKPWPGKTVWASQLGDWSVMSVKRPDGDLQLGPKDPIRDPCLAWLTEFEDRSSPRPGTDEVYFQPSADQQPVERPPIIISNTKVVLVTPWWHMAVCFGVPLALFLGGLVGWRLLRRV